MTLPAYQPLVSLRRAIESGHALDEGDRDWLKHRSLG
jgi:hypothetical protein